MIHRNIYIYILCDNVMISIFIYIYKLYIYISSNHVINGKTQPVHTSWRPNSLFHLEVQQRTIGNKYKRIAKMGPKTRTMKHRFGFRKETPVIW